MNRARKQMVVLRGIHAREENREGTKYTGRSTQRLHLSRNLKAVREGAMRIWGGRQVQ